MNKIILSILMAFCFFPAFAQNETVTETPEESQPDGTTLKELVVEGKNAWFEGNKAIFVPDKNEKKLAKDAPSLIDNMGTPLLYTEGGQIKSRIGGNVQIFINGIRADDNDLKTFWPMNAIRVEYIQNPDDPRFEGASNVVNFIMKEYTYGGLTSVDAFQVFPNSGQYSLASKFVYKKMTYSASAEGRYSRDHISGEYEQEDFRDVWYQGKHYDQIERRTTFNNNADRNDRINASFVARYNNQGKFIASHSGVFSWNRNPGSFRNGSTDYTPMLFDGTSTQSYSENRNPSAAVTGRYNYIINSKFSIAWWWNYGYSYRSGVGSSSEGELTPITTRTRENFNTGSACIGLNWRINKKMMLGATFVAGIRHFSTTYSGTSLADNKSTVKIDQNRNSYEVEIGWRYFITKKLNITVVPKLNVFDRKITGSGWKTELNPALNLMLQSVLNDKNSISAHFSSSQEPPAASQVNDLILRQSELMWIEGNPSIKHLKQYAATLAYTSMPCKWLNFNIDANWQLLLDQTYCKYKPGGTAYDGVIRQYSSGTNQVYESVNGYVEFMLFGKHLRLKGELHLSHTNYTGTGKHHTSFRPVLRANVYFGNCMAGFSYHFKDRRLTDGGTTMLHRPHRTYIYFKYGTGAFNLDIGLSQPFDKHDIHRYIIESGPYRNERQTWRTGRSVQLSLSYTFDYGKKIDPGIDKAGAGPGESSILN